MTEPRSHHDELRHALVTLTMTPSELTFHYIRAVLDEEGGNKSATARRIGVHRRTLQRMLAIKRPKGRVTE